LRRRKAESAKAEDRNRFPGLQARLAESMQGGGRGAHHDRALDERDFLRQHEEAARRDAREFGVAAVAMFPDHAAGFAELLMPCEATGAMAASVHVMHANPRAFGNMLDVGPDFLRHAGDFMSQRHGQRTGFGQAGAVMRVRVANARRRHPHEHVLRPGLRQGQYLQREGLANFHQTNCFHGAGSLALNPAKLNLRFKENLPGKRFDL